eukprot:TRINITY_DN11002_c0_g1_i1.p1 TRINITY_DN11002_c0_g1~~TRINITY_DN11002_c0_g1_i1.p1  ORF type:complete len:120 (+),score=24.29 TRINITY_DN11002_c0_g1_i1:231-590(+)
MKQQKDSKEGIHFTAIREIKFLRELHHEYIIELKSVFSKHNALYLVLEYLPNHFTQIIQAKNLTLNEAHIKSYMYMLLQGVLYLHSNWCIHRDLKPDNLLIAPAGQLKVSRRDKIEPVG